jgi:hypothetical protein
MYFGWPNIKNGKLCMWIKEKGLGKYLKRAALVLLPFRKC